MTLQELRWQLADNLEAQQALVEGAALLKRDLSPSEKVELAELEGEEARLERQEKQLERLGERMDVLAGPTSTSPGVVIPRDDIEETSSIPERTGKRDYRSLFGAPAGTSEFRGLPEMMLSIYSGRADARLTARAAAGANTVLGAEGGYLVPEQLVVELFNSALEQSIVLNRADLGPLRNGSRLVTSFDESDRSNGDLYGFSSGWFAEGDEITLSKPAFRQFSLKARKLAILTAATNEMLHDALQGGSGIEQGLARAIAFSIDRTLLVDGNGAGRPLSVLNSPSKLTVSKEGSQAANTITFRNLSTMESRLAPEFDRQAIWIASPSCRPQLLETSIELISGTQRAHIPALKKEGGSWTLLGREILWSEHLPSIGNQGDIMLVSLPLYAVGVAKEISIDRSEHVYFTSDQTAFRSIMRVDGAAKLASVITPSNSGDTLSWCLTLEDRLS